MTPLAVDWPTTLAAVAVGIVAVARLTRLIVDDDWPPIVALRNGWRRATGYGPWSHLVDCPFCVAPYFTAATIAWAMASDLHWSWWAFHGWLAAAYLAAMINVRDIPGPTDTEVHQ